MGPEINPDAKVEAKMGFPNEGPIELNGSNVGEEGVGNDEEIDLPTLPLKAGGFAIGVASDPARVGEGLGAWGVTLASRARMNGMVPPRVAERSSAKRATV